MSRRQSWTNFANLCIFTLLQRFQCIPRRFSAMFKCCISETIASIRMCPIRRWNQANIGTIKRSNWRREYLFRGALFARRARPTALAVHLVRISRWLQYNIYRADLDVKFNQISSLEISSPDEHFADSCTDCDFWVLIYIYIYILYWGWNLIRSSWIFITQVAYTPWRSMHGTITVQRRRPTPCNRVGLYVNCGRSVIIPASV